MCVWMLTAKRPGYEKPHGNCCAAQAAGPGSAVETENCLHCVQSY